MSKAVMISIQPKWCEKIANGIKTIEIRKTRPKLEPPLKCYIYCTRRKHKNAFHTYVNSGYGRENFGVIGHWRSGKEIVDVNAHLPACRYNAYLAESKVIGEFVCDYITEITHGVEGDGTPYINTGYVGGLDCLTYEEKETYLQGKTGYGWHISDLVIYDKPKELSEFSKPCICTDEYEGETYCNCLHCDLAGDSDYGIVACDRKLKKPPQSWCYVEEVQT